jgi:hypothetical protein
MEFAERAGIEGKRKGTGLIFDFRRCLSVVPFGDRPKSSPSDEAEEAKVCQV